jgi:hypothetical protein
MVSVGLGQPYRAAFLVTDSNGAPVTAGVTGSMSLYGPASATAIGGPTALTHLADGLWGVTWAGSLTGTPGEYRYLVPALAFGATTLANQAGDFSAGVLPPGQRTLRDLLIALNLPLNDGWWGTASADGTTGAASGTLIDSRLINASGVADDWAGSEVLPFQSAAPTSTRTRPYRVTGFAPTTGTLTVAPGPAALVASGTDYLLCNENGAGFGVQRRLQALQAALRMGGAARRVSDQVSVVAAGDTDEYALPAALLTVSGVAARAAGGQADRWTPLAPDRWRRMLRADRRLLTLAGYAAGTLVRVEGYAYPSLPYFLDQFVEGPADWYVTRAAADLLKASPLAAHQRMAGPLFQEALATRPRRTPDPNEIVLG